MASAHRAFVAAALALLVVFPLAAQYYDQGFYIGFASRILILAIAASSLNLILGYGGMISFGHAAFLGSGGYVVGILMAEGVASAWVTWPLAVGLSALFALAIGAISLRTRGVYFIMITLAFAQMMYYIFVSMKAYGGDDGLNLASRSQVGFGVDLGDDLTWYFVVLAFYVLVMWALRRLIGSRFGRVIQAIRENETRMEAIGFPTYRYKLAAFVIAGAIAGLSGALIANHNVFVSPNLMFWVQSGTLMIMVILGGVGFHYGGTLGAAIILVLEELISGYTVYWQLWEGAILLAVVLFAPQGVASLFVRGPAAKAR